MSGHDYSNRRGKGVKRAVQEMFAGMAVNSTAGDRCASWWIQV